VVEACPPFPREDLVRAYFLVVAAGVGFYVEEAARHAGLRPRARDFEPTTWLMALIAWKTTGADMERARQTIQKAARPIAGFMQDHDLFLTATCAQPPARIGQLMPSGSEKAQMAALRRLPFKALLDFALSKMGSSKLAWTPNTQLFNQTGQPAISLPLYWNTAGLPIGVQLAARFGDEATLFRVSAELEAARPWADRRPPMLAG
jgi:amidase